jgi:hypothetical protein
MKIKIMKARWKISNKTMNPKEIKNQPIQEAKVLEMVSLALDH